ncbi:hypothetical protein [Aquamicrobium zhengzhouense]|uniref:AAA domain-containing protein n=1 Tax=Aquamicrobium zhengzhouense TaxID=2781738 RepID=A0ABS0S9S8_9HYPH|nr:hypothetical protein [Aquamicrobium zhengzhouense]MBI1620043.1 hypothetical protein [Aquamicrobium zhengzhouense]
MKTIIVVNGKPRAGKDTAVEMMRCILWDQQIHTTSFSSIQPIKDLLAPVADLSAKTPADRKLLSVVGDALQEHSQFRTNAALGQMHAMRDGSVFFLHIREPDLIELLRQECLSYGWRFERVFVESNRAEDVQNNPSDANVATGEYDHRLYNNGTLAELDQECFELLLRLRLI